MYCKVYILFVWLKLINSPSTYDMVGSVARVLLYARSDKVEHEGPSALNYLHHARKTLFHWKLTHNHFTQENSIAVDIQLCCLMDPHLFSDFRGYVKWCTWACGFGP